MSQASVSLIEVTFPDITGKTLRAFGQVDVTAGTYVTGGLPFGLVAFADARSIDFNGFLRCEVWDEEGVSTLYTYHYDAANDKLQIFSGATEVSNGAAVPVTDAALNVDGPPVDWTSPRTNSANVLMFEATFDRTTVRG